MPVFFMEFLTLQIMLNFSDNSYEFIDGKNYFFHICSFVRLEQLFFTD